MLYFFPRWAECSIPVGETFNYTPARCQITSLPDTPVFECQTDASYASLVALVVEVENSTYSSHLFPGAP